jgi:DNA polymerase-3 subunit epsilon
VNANSLPAWAQTLVVFDLETTGIDEREARVVTAYIGVLDHTGEVLPGGQSWLANPGIDIPETASAVHGITTEFAQANGADAATVVGELLERLRDLMSQGIMVVAYNAAYDFTVMHYEALRYGLAPLEPTLVYDPMVVDKHVDQYRKGKRTLTVACEVYGVSLDDAHEASADAIAAGRVALAVAAKFKPALPPEGAVLHSSQIGWKEEQDASFAKWKRSVGDPEFQHVPGWPVKKY